jgi:diguanylate cyclase
VSKLTEQQNKNIEKALWDLVKLKNDHTFDFITTSIAHYLGADFAFISRLPKLENDHVKTVSFFADGKLANTYHYVLKNTPCALVVANSKMITYEKNVQHEFPMDEDLKTMGIQSYMGASLTDSNNTIIGLMSIMSHNPLIQTTYAKKIFEVYRSRASMELARLIQEEKLIKSKQLFEQVVQSSPLGIFLVDENGMVKFCNRPAIKLFGYTERELIDQNIKKIIPLEIKAKHPHLLKSSMNSLNLRNICSETKKGKTISLDITLSSLETMLGYRTMCSVLDISKQKESEEKLQKMINKDSLTKLPNHKALMEAVSHIIDENISTNTLQASVLYIDIDDFKKINDFFGHVIGDKVLVVITRRLLKLRRDDDFIARVGGDEFILLAKELNNESHAGQIAKRIISKLSRTIVIDGNPIKVSVSIGIAAIHPKPGISTSTLIEYADVAMYEAKKTGKNNFKYFTKTLAEQYKRKKIIGNLLYSALEKKEFSLVYQPIMDVTNNTLVGMEALLRWHSSEIGPIDSEEFIPIAEEKNLMVAIGDFVLHSACEQLVLWNTQTKQNHLKLNINLSSLQLTYHQADKHILSILKKYSSLKQQLVFELTESIIMEETSLLLETLNALLKQELCFALDDFGTGYSSLSCLMKIPVNYLKIDKSFIQKISTSSDARAIVQSTIKLGEVLKIKVVAEGVETKEQLNFLKQHGCKFVQGYYFYKPMPAEEMLTLICNPSSK